MKEGYLPNKRKDKEQSELTVKSKRSVTREDAMQMPFSNGLSNGVKRGRYEIARFHESHTHALASPMKRLFLRSARRLNPIKKTLLHAYNKSNIRPSKIVHLLKNIILMQNVSS